MYDFAETERSYLLSVLFAAHTQLMHDLHHADSTAYKQQLRHQIELNEAVTAKVEARVTTPV